MEKNYDLRSTLVMKLLHYFITEAGYKPIILQGATNEIWLENINSDYKVVRLVSDYIHNKEQMQFDVFKAKRIANKIKRKTFSWNINILSIYFDLGDNASLVDEKDYQSLYIKDEKDFEQKKLIDIFPDIKEKLVFNEEGVKLFLKITQDIDQSNRKENAKNDEVFKPKKPTMTYVLIIMSVVVYLLQGLYGYDLLYRFAVNGSLVRAGQYYRLITGAFFHVDFIHLLFNMYALYIIGSQIESYLGKVKYLGIYFVSALTGSLLSIITNTGFSVGASGAIFGLMGAFLIFGYYYRTVLGEVLKGQIIPVIVINLLFGFMMSGVDNAGHIGGLLGGISALYAFGVKYKSTKEETINGKIILFIFIGFLLFMAFR